MLNGSPRSAAAVAVAATPAAAAGKTEQLLQHQGATATDGALPSGSGGVSKRPAPELKPNGSGGGATDHQHQQHQDGGGGAVGSNMMMETDGCPPKEEEDVIVKEVDVFLSQHLADELSLFQYPLRPAVRPYNPATLAEVKMKPTQYKVQLEYQLDTKHETYDADGQLGGGGGGGDGTASGGLQSTVLVSSRVPLDYCSYAVAVYRQGQLHLTRLERVLQLRPSLRHLDELDSRRKQEAAAAKLREEHHQHLLLHPDASDEEDEDHAAPMEVDEEPKLTPIGVQFKKRDSQRVLTARKKSHAFMARADEDEPWLPLAHFDASSDEARYTFERLLSADTSAEARPLLSPAATSAAYLSELHRTPAAPDSSDADSVFSLEAVRRMPLEQQLRALLLHAHVMSTESLLSLATAARSEQQLLDTLLDPVGAVLVRGNWLLSSEQACEGSRRQALARDYLLCTLHCQQWLVNRREFTEFVRLPPELVRDLFDSLADHVKDRGWRLRRDTDVAFIKRYPAIAEKFDKMWAERAKTIKDEIINAKPDPKPPPDAKGAKKQLLAGAGPAAASQKQAGAAGDKSAAGKLAQQQPPAGSGAAAAAAGAAAGSPAAARPPPPRTGAAADPFEGKTAQEQLQAFVVQQLRRHMVVSLGTLRQALVQRAAQANPKNLLLPASPAVADERLSEVLQPIADAINGAYFLRSVGVPSIDKYRDIVLDVFRQKQTITRADVKEEALKRIKEDVPSSLFDKLIKELGRQQPNGTFVFKTP